MIPSSIDPWQSPIATPSLTASQVHVWRTSFDALMPMLHALQRLLVPEEQERAARCVLEYERRQFVIGRAVLRSIIGMYLGKDPRCLPLDYTDHGKPVLDPSCNHADIRFNLSHSGDWLVCAVGCGQSVGIDVERMRADIDVEGIAAYIFTPSDQRAFLNQPPHAKLRSLFTAWAYKEAYLKAIGTGMTARLRSVSVPMRSGGNSISWTRVGPAAASWNALQLHVDVGYAAALVIERAVSELSYFEWSGTRQFTGADTSRTLCTRANETARPID